ncbi:hypothetical protein K2X05_13045 [bacterium]|nr:hypothetical protein [bacterium]
MKYLIGCFILFFTSGCLDIYNSSTEGSGGLAVGAGDSPAFVAAKTLFTINCGSSGCHPGFGSKSEAEFISEGFVVVADPENSKIYYRLAGSTGTMGNKNMPQGQPPLDSTQLQVVSDWIMGITP